MQQAICHKPLSTNAPLSSRKALPYEEDSSISTPYIRSSAVCPDSEEDPYDECCGDSNDLIKATVPYAEPEESMLRSLPATKKTKGMDFSDADGQNLSCNLMMDSLDSEWTDDKHSSYLDSIEASFVKQMYEDRYCDLGLHSQALKQWDSLDPDSAESKLKFPSFNEFKVWENGDWQHYNVNRTQLLEPPVVTIPEVMACPWMQHFVPVTSSRGQAVTTRTVHVSSSNCGVLTDGELKNGVESKRSGCIRTFGETAPQENHGFHVWQKRIQRNFRGATRVCGEREHINMNARKSHVSTTHIAGKQIQDSEEKAKVEGSSCNRIVKKQSISIDGVCHSTRDQKKKIYFNANTQP